MLSKFGWEECAVFSALESILAQILFSVIMGWLYSAKFKKAYDAKRITEKEKEFKKETFKFLC